jgi:hypothetical protein
MTRLHRFGFYESRKLGKAGKALDLWLSGSKGFCGPRCDEPLSGAHLQAEVIPQWVSLTLFAGLIPSDRFTAFAHLNPAEV